MQFLNCSFSLSAPPLHIGNVTVAHKTFFLSGKIITPLINKSVFVNKQLKIRTYSNKEQEKDVNVTAIRVFFYVNSIQNPFVNPKLINTTNQKKWDALYALI